jgi:hypothetical protein
MILTFNVYGTYLYLATYIPYPHDFSEKLLLLLAKRHSECHLFHKQSVDCGHNNFNATNNSENNSRCHFSGCAQCALYALYHTELKMYLWIINVIPILKQTTKLSIRVVEELTYSNVRPEVETKSISHIINDANSVCLCWFKLR